MPNFKIRRRKKKVEPPARPTPTPEEKYDEAEESMSETSEETMIDTAMQGLEVTPLRRTNTEPQNVPAPRVLPRNRPHNTQYTENSRPHYQIPTNVVTPQPKPARYSQHFQAPPHIPNQYTCKPTMPIQKTQ